MCQLIRHRRCHSRAQWGACGYDLLSQRTKTCTRWTPRRRRSAAGSRRRHRRSACPSPGGERRAVVRWTPGIAQGGRWEAVSPVWQQHGHTAWRGPQKFFARAFPRMAMPGVHPASACLSRALSSPGRGMASQTIMQSCFARHPETGRPEILCPAQGHHAHAASGVAQGSRVVPLRRIAPVS